MLTPAQWKEVKRLSKKIHRLRNELLDAMGKLIALEYKMDDKEKRKHYDMR